MFAAIVIAVLTGFLLSRCVTRTPAFRPVKDSLLWLGTVLAAHLLADWLSLPLYIARLCDVEMWRFRNPGRSLLLTDCSF